MLLDSSVLRNQPDLVDGTTATGDWTPTVGMVVGLGSGGDETGEAAWYAPESTKRRLRSTPDDGDVSTSTSVSGSHTKADTPLD
jgi:hypothetical protein